MYPPDKPLEPGQPVNIELPAKIVCQENRGNRHWYLCMTTDGALHRVEISRITLQHDNVYFLLGDDGSFTLQQRLLSKTGKLQLYELLRTQLEAEGTLPSQTIEQIRQKQETAPTEQQEEEEGQGDA